MISHLTLATLLLRDGGLADIFQSPYIVPVAGTVMILGIVVAAIWAGVRGQEMRSQERLAAIAKGIPLEPTLAEAVLQHANLSGSRPVTYRPNNGAGARRAGLILLFTGLGLMAFFFALAAIVRVREVLSGAAVGLVPALIGIGFLIDARLRRVEYNRALEAEPPSSLSRSASLTPLH